MFTEGKTVYLQRTEEICPNIFGIVDNEKLSLIDSNIISCYLWVVELWIIGIPFILIAYDFLL